MHLSRRFRIVRSWR